jgi:hypothetical protein
MSTPADSEITNVTQFGVEVSAHSYLTFSKLRKYNEVTFWERPELPDVNPTELDVLYSLGVADCIDNIAKAAYGDNALWWALAIANSVRLPPLQMNPGYLFRLVDGGAINNILRNKAQ